MSAKWPRVKLADLLRYRKEFVLIDDLIQYKRPRVQLHAKGIVLRDEVPGALIKTKQQQVCRAGEFLVAEIDAKVGGFGVVPESLDGSIVSSHYFLYVVDESKLDRRFLDCFSRTPVFRNQIEAQGSTNYAAIRPSDVLGYEIPLPSLPEQRRIVARIEGLAGKIDEAHGLRRQAIEAIDAFGASRGRVIIGESPDTTWVPLNAFISEIENGKSPACESRPAEIDEWGVLKVGAVSFGVFKERENKALPAGYQVNGTYEVKAGDFLMSRANTAELVGACAIVEHTRRRLLLSDKSFRFHFRQDVNIIPAWLDYVMKSPALREQIVRGATGTSPTMKNISKEKVLALLVPPHNEAEQREIVEELDAFRAKADALKRLQYDTATELDALLPSIMDRAFKGEL